ncbi:MAG: nucleoside-diphosphate kinase [Candidatus Aureabacteria bacterium]|nr:nucleoside-diphosphate kinase [Candidatus Auribacterota bacterium]
MHRTLFIVKPDAYGRGIADAILGRIGESGLRIVYSEKRRLARAEVEELYREHRDKPFFRENTDFMIGGEVGLFLVEGEGDAAGRLRKLLGNKDPALAGRGTIRGDFGIDSRRIERNLVHASSSPEDAEREIALLFGGAEGKTDRVLKRRSHV